jgi:excisionase family DNA binding protein
MTTTIDKKKYLELMDTADISTKVIETEDEYDRFLAVAEKLMHKRIDRTPEDTALLMLVVKLIEDYESIHHNLDDWKKSTPADLLNVSRPFLVKLLESGELAHRMVGKHRRVLLQDVMKYKENIDRLGGALRVRARNETLNELVAQAQELNMGYE